MTQGTTQKKAKIPPRLALALISLTVGMAACDKIQNLSRHESGKAFINTQIPPDLAPKYYPPNGFVFSGFKTRGLPEARYGVASPPINPHAQVLILVEADYPAEAYFGIMRDLLDGGYSVWLLELPGQGGAGRYHQQHEAIDMPDYHNGIDVINDFIDTVIIPTDIKPLYIVGSGVSATQSLLVFKSSSRSKIKGAFAFKPYLGTTISRGDLWHRQDKITTQLGQIAQSWQVFNPDLRMKAHSDSWIEAQKKSFKALNSPNLPNLTLKHETHKAWVLAPEALKNTYKPLCNTLGDCTIQTTDDMSDIGTKVVFTLGNERTELRK